MTSFTDIVSTTRYYNDVTYANTYCDFIFNSISYCRLLITANKFENTASPFIQKNMFRK